MDRLATLRGPPERLRRLVRETTLTTDADDPFYPLVRLSVTGAGLEAATPTGGAEPTFCARYDAAFFDSFAGPDEPCLAALGTGATLRWLDWVDGGDLAVALLGDADEGIARAIRLEGGDDSVEISPLPSDTVDPDFSTGRPDAFEDGRFVYEGTAAPTRVETTGRRSNASSARPTSSATRRSPWSSRTASSGSRSSAT
ncbi:hypothetical protein ACFQL4_01455 [Halosimplex aquaticum]